MSSRAKGNRNKRKALKYLEEQGYITDTVELTGKFRKYKDLFSGYCTACWKREDDCCKKFKRFDGFDIVGIRSRLPVIVLVQIKSNQPPTQQPYKDFAALFASRYIGVWCMTHYDYKGWRIQKYYSNGQIKEIDLRK